MASLKEAKLNEMIGGISQSSEAMSTSPVRGDGGGLADAVPSALSEGEFVIPADVVAALGQGSSEAGARVIQQVIDDVRNKASTEQGEKAQTGSANLQQGLPGAI